MTRQVGWFVAALVMSGALVGTESRTAEGVDAFARGDYQQAAEILKPIAESWASRDHVAEFFMGMLYESGRGVAADQRRACALYIRSSLDGSGPFGPQAQALVFAQQRTLSREDFDECVFLSSVGFEHGFQPVTFNLEQRQWISVDFRGFTIAYEGKERRVDEMFAPSGAKFLPIEHTELTAGRLQTTRRHFIEFFAWMPDQTGQKWTLFWRVFEVIRDGIVPVVFEELAAISADRPPSPPAFDVHDLARLRVNDRGDPEWAVLGPNPRSEGIESEAERREADAREKARAAAEKQVDWEGDRDPQSVPTLTYADAEGCGNLFVYAWSSDRTEVMTFRADKDLLGLTPAGPRTVDIASLPADLELLVHVYSRPMRSWPFCTDVHLVDRGVSEQTWTAVSGVVTIAVSSPGIRARTPSAYRATVRVVDAEFVSAAGVHAKQSRPITLTVAAGSF